MKKLLAIVSLLMSVSCEQVVNIDLPTASARLVIDASIKWEKGSKGNLQTISLTTTAGYYDTDIPKVLDATVFVTDSKNNIFSFLPNPSSQTGNYMCDHFEPVIGETYTLTIIHKGETYRAEEKLVATPEIRDVEQRNDFGLNSDEIGIRVNFIDTPREDNFYLFKFATALTAFPQYQIIDDRFTQGGVTSELYSVNKLKNGDIINLELQGISQTYYNYVKIVLSNATGGGPFQLPPIRVKGNIINQRNKDNYALGYFRLSEIDTYNYVVQ